MVASRKSNENQRNYQLDALKFFLACLVILYHTHYFVGENTRITLPPMLGFMCVQCFFVISGMLMVNSYIFMGDVKDCGKNAFLFVLHKFKSLALPYWVSLGLRAIVQAVLYATSLDVVLRIILIETVPEALGMQLAGVGAFLNGPVWYISAMLIAMLPLVYILMRNKNFFLYVFAPLCAIISWGYIYANNDAWVFNYQTMHGFLMGGVIRALSGLCFGVISYLISDWLKNNIRRKSQRVLLTVIEPLLYIVFFVYWFTSEWTLLVFSGFFLFPIAVGITFSRCSYINELFKAGWMKHLGHLSLAVYLNHSGAVQIVDVYFHGLSWKMSAFLVVLFTIGMCLIYYGILYVIRLLWNKRLKSVFGNEKTL